MFQSFFAISSHPVVPFAKTEGLWESVTVITGIVSCDVEGRAFRAGGPLLLAL
jgi:hypothetical protein